MSKRAEQKALKAYPVQGRWIGNQYGDWEEDTNRVYRNVFLDGYEQAEKDLELTADDVKNIFNRVRDEQIKHSATEGCYQEVADWFNKQRNDTRD